jgi:hypothetical protein
LLVSQHVRHIQIDDKKYHSAIDVLNIVDNFENEPRIFLRQFKNRLKKSLPKLYQKMIQVKLPSWDDHKWYNADVVDTGWLFWLVAESKSELAQQFKDAFAEELNRNPQLESERLARQIDSELHGIGSEVSLLMQSIYQQGDYDYPIVPPGCPS